MLFCVIDGGLDPTHPDFKARNFNMTACDGLESQMCYTYNVDVIGHGTHVTGTIAAARNGLGVVGVAAEGARVHVVNALPAGFFWASDEIVAYQDCLRQLDQIKKDTGNMDFKMVVSMSYGGLATPLQLWWDGTAEYMDLYYSRGDVLFVAAAGNDGTGNTSYPSGYRNAISVAALNASGSPAEFSQFNADVELIAPGVSVLSTVPAWRGFSADVPLLTTSPAIGGDPAIDNLLTPPPVLAWGLAGVTGEPPGLGNTEHLHAILCLGAALCIGT